MHGGGFGRTTRQALRGSSSRFGASGRDVDGHVVTVCRWSLEVAGMSIWSTFGRYQSVLSALDWVLLELVSITRHSLNLTEVNVRLPIPLYRHAPRRPGHLYADPAPQAGHDVLRHPLEGGPRRLQKVHVERKSHLLSMLCIPSRYSLAASRTGGCSLIYNRRQLTLIAA